MRKLYVGRDRLGNEAIYVETINTVYRYHPDLNVFVQCSSTIEQLKKIFDLEFRKELKDGERVSEMFATA